MSASFKGGVMIESRKDKTSAGPIARPDTPEELIVSMSQHNGPECTPCVSVGDRVNIGQIIGDSDDFAACPVHAPVSGVVTSVSPEWHPCGTRRMSVVIKNDFRESMDPSCVPYEGELSPETIIGLSRAGGVVGMGGGSGLPLHIKLRAALDKGTELLVVNGMECEPFVSADHRAMVEYPNVITDGILLVMKCLSPKEVVLVVGEDKPDAFATMRLMCEGKEIRVISLPAKYPQGEEKQLIASLTGSEVPEGMTPLDIGCLVLNVDTCACLSRWIHGGRPVTKRVVTVSGPAVVNPRNLLVRIGTSYRTLFEHCGGFTQTPTKIVSGGAMRGMAQHTLDTPVVKGTNVLLAFTENNGEVSDVCLHCGKCIRVCPMRLIPTNLYNAAKAGQYDVCKKYRISQCSECGCCSYVCPGKLYIVQMIRTAKAAISLQESEEDGEPV